MLTFELNRTKDESMQSSLTAEEIRLVQDSIQHILPLAQSTGENFYQRLFTIAPQLRPLFKNDMAAQSRKLMTILIHIIANLDDFQRVDNELRELARRHIAYHVKEEDYRFIGEALFWTLAQIEEIDWTPALADAWDAAYANIANVMLEEHQDKGGA